MSVTLQIQIAHYIFSKRLKTINNDPKIFMKNIKWNKS